MTDSLQNPLALMGRFLLAPMFVLAGFGKLTGFAGTVAYMQSKGIPATELLATLAALLELGGGLALLFGFYTRWAALALAGFTVIASLIFHDFWAVPEAQRMVQNLLFMKNISVAGGLLVLAAFGPGAWSIDSRRTGSGRRGSVPALA
ncbi:MAG: DoxX family protein [Caldimonas sp.]